MGMKKFPNSFIVYSVVAILVMVVFVPFHNACAFFGEQPSVLSKIENYKAPPFPVGRYTDSETYDYRINHGKPVPPTLVDTFICDLWTTLNRYYASNAMSPYNIQEKIVKKVLEIYKTHGWEYVPGYRPWVDWNFINSLNKDEFDTLVKEVTEYMHKNGVSNI
jgi:hypothetical protein